MFLCFIGYLSFSSILYSSSIIINYGIHPFDICKQNPDLWHYIKICFVITYFFSSIIISNLIYSNVILSLKHYIIIFFNSSIFFHIKHSFLNFLHYIFHTIHKLNNSHNLLHFEPTNIIKEKNSEPIKLYIGKTCSTNQNIYLPEKSLYQNILVTGTIGTGKTSSAMYPFTKQLISYNNRISLLVLDVKGNYYIEIKNFCKEFSRLDDLIIIELNGTYKYNPLHKPNLKASVLANRLKTILLLFSPNNSESYWLDKVEEVLAECIKLCRLYNNGYVTFEELHKLVTDEDYYKEKIPIFRKHFLDNKLSEENIYNLLSALTFFQKEFFSLDTRTLSILKSEITRITNCFVSDYQVLKTFCPTFEELNFFGFEDAINNGKIVVLNMNISEYRNLSKIIAAYLKLDFQTEVMNRLAKNKNTLFQPVAFICDEYSEYCTISDSEFFAQSREAKCINIVATQSYTSLLNTLNNSYAVQVIIQNLINKLWFRTDDMNTIEDAQKQIGKEDKNKISKSISENANKIEYNYFSGSLNSGDSSISESINTYMQTDYIYDTNFFTQNLENFSCLAFLSDGNKILNPEKLKLKPYFEK